jgi:hypothetical protein
VLLVAAYLLYDIRNLLTNISYPVMCNILFHFVFIHATTELERRFSRCVLDPNIIVRAFLFKIRSTHHRIKSL